MGRNGRRVRRDGKKCYLGFLEGGGWGLGVRTYKLRVTGSSLAVQ